jgi:hypothetical protein
VGDESVLQAVEDQLRSYPATKVVVVSGRDGGEGDADRALAALEARLEAEFTHIVAGS